MRTIFLTFFLLVGLCTNAQNTDLEVQIDSITHHDTSTSERIFTVHYHIKNKAKSLISLVLNTKELRSNMYNNSSWIPSYRLFQEKKMIETNTVFDSKKSDAVLKKIMQDLENNRKGLADYLLKQQKELKIKTSKKIIESIVRFQPNETKNFSATLSWDKNRYHKFEDNEYFLDQKTTHYLDLFLYLNKEELTSTLLPEDLKIILNDPTIITGWIYTNKVEINFKY
ncbi:hypothetical protein IQ05_00677 [Flavobacterium tiangeerense]|uniref:GLPGLI family protein n=1 Tax=Flavobacterium tiangeerense TaxID=459471 RepID=A0ABY3FMY0_9FLAO|nr:hypothetical protein [Flavobacterium tiangeerense]TWI02424.1 hypothetical protein IQ05_00677 [Flavobacterium tiangeerense]